MEEKLSKTKVNAREKYWASKPMLDIIRDDVTMKRYKILSAANKLGKKGWGHAFTRRRLSDDMEMAFSTVTRCLALDKANKTTWARIKKKEISVFKAAMALQGKNTTFQDEVVDLIIEKKLSTCQIKTIKVNKLKDVKKEKLRLATQNGFSRKSSALVSLNAWMSRGKLLLLMDKSHLPIKDLPQVEKDLLSLKIMIESYLKL